MEVNPSSSHVRDNLGKFLSESSFWVPEAFVTSAWIGHAPFAFWLAECLRPNTFVELGAYYGYSYLAFNQAFKKLGTKTHCFAIDTWRGDEHAGFYGDEIFDYLNAYNLQHYSDFSELIRSTFDDAVGLFEDDSVDLLHIDGRHFYDDVKHDFLTWKSKLSKRGVVLFHDTNITARGFGVFQLWEELKTQYPHFEFLTEHGLGVIGVGSSLPKALEALFAASSDVELTRQIRDTYGRLGQDLENRRSLRQALEDRGRLAIGGEVDFLNPDAVAQRMNELSEELARHREIVAEYHRLRVAEAEAQQRLGELSEELRRGQHIHRTYEGLHTQHQSLLVAHKRSESLRQEAEGALQRLNTDNEALKTAGVALDRALQDARNAFAAQGNEVERLRVTIDDQQHQLSLERRNLALVRSSTSWRLTRPVRWISERLPTARKARTVAALPWWLITGRLPGKMRYRNIKKMILRSGLFDAEHYLQVYSDVSESGLNPLDHFLNHGGSEGRSPHPLFDANWYLDQNPDVRASGTNPLVHYLLHGAAEGRDPNPFFDSAYYLEQRSKPIPEGATPLGTFISEGARHQVNPCPLFDSQFYRNQNPDLLASGVLPVTHYLAQPIHQRKSPHPLFDKDYYLDQNPGVRDAGQDALIHYLSINRTGDPHPLFDSEFYINAHPDAADVRASGTNPLVHYLLHGAAEGRDPNPFFDSAYYLEQRSKPIPEGATPLGTFISEGARHQVNPCPLFDSQFYRNQNPDLLASGVLPVTHYLAQPIHQRKSPHPLFDKDYYLDQNPGVRDAGQDALIHYLSINRTGDPHPLFDSEFYIKAHPDAAVSNVCPLVHYLRWGWRDGVAPHLDFDANFYRNKYLALAGPDVDPLIHYLTVGVGLKTDPSTRFDTAGYLAEYEDVAAKGMNPLAHYVRYGRSEGRQPFPARRFDPTAMSRRPRIVFVSGEADTPGHYYRVTNLATALAPRFFETIIISVSELPKRLGEISGAAIVWLWRATWSNQIEELLRAARAVDARLVFDIDDLMFRPEIAKLAVIDGIRSMGLTEHQVRQHYSDVQRVFLAADYCSVPTFSLAAEAGDFKPSAVIPNGFDRHALELARTTKVLRGYQESDGLLRIGYASGSRTHQKDLAVASTALARILTDVPSARLVLFSRTIELSEFPDLKKVWDQIEWRELVPIESLLKEYARFDINIAPLEVGNRFCEAKSELKYFEAALVGVPTVASPTRPFSGAIRHGETGFLVNGSDEWYSTLLNLCQDSELRLRVAEAANEEVLWRYGPERRSILATRFVNRLIAPPSIGSDLFAVGLETENALALPIADVPEFDVLFQSEWKAQSRVSVVIPLFNYAAILTEALESVRCQTVRTIDLIIVDDRSTDNSLEVARTWLERNAAEFNRVTLLQNKRNSKLGRTRNAGVSFAETELFIPLDPDNLLLPECIKKCVEHLDATGAAFAYPTIQCFGERTEQIGCDDFDPALLQRGNFIDAMAMVKKAFWIAVGGYSNLNPMGWEDYDFWCKFVEHGFFGVRVPDVIARYRAHDQSMLRTITNVRENLALVVKDMSTRHPWVNIHLLEAGEERADGSAESAPTSEAEHQFPPRKVVDWLLPLLRCPATGENLIELSSDAICTESGSREWPLVAGKPVFTTEGRGIVIQAETHTSNALSEEATQMISESSGLVLNLSAGGTLRPYPNVIELEYTLFRNTTLAGDVHRLPFKDEIFDVVVCFNAFEHYREPEKAMDEIRRVLKVGGKFLMRTAFLQPLHEAPHHYYNCTEFGLRHWLKNFQIDRVNVSENFNPVYALSWLCSEVESGFASGVSAEAAAMLGNGRLSEFAEFWRNPSSRDSSLWKAFYQLPMDVQAKLAAGWEALSTKSI